MCGPFGDDYDRIYINESDGEKFYGYDDGEGTTYWYMEDGCLDSSTPTPVDFDDDEW